MAAAAVSVALPRRDYVALLRLAGPGDRAGAWPADPQPDETPA